MDSVRNEGDTSIQHLTGQVLTLCPHQDAGDDDDGVEDDETIMIFMMMMMKAATLIIVLIM